MSNPFPGMNPYLEQDGIWPDFHSTFLNYWREAIAELLPEHYVARIDERVNLVQRDADELRTILPDVSVSRFKQEEPSQVADSAGLATLEPITIPLVFDEPWRQGYIEILRHPERELVAILELLSPSNKRGRGLGEYLGRRGDVLRQEIHLVELDLLLAGERMPLSKPLPPGDYYALLARADRRPDCDVYAWSVRAKLPKLPIPLLPPDGDVTVDLAPVMATAFARGRYAKVLNYAAPPESVGNSAHSDWIGKVATSNGA